MQHPTQLDLLVSNRACSRRTFLAAAAGAIAGTAAWARSHANPSPAAKLASRSASHLICINLVGGPSQIDTWDPKPDADSSIRNFDPACATSVPGVFISENLPRLAQRMHLVSLVRSLHHSGPATHAAGQQLLMTGSCFYHDQPAPYFGSVAAHVLGDRTWPDNLILGGRLSAELVSDPGAQTAAWLPSEVNPIYFGGESPAACLQVNDQDGEPCDSDLRYGSHHLGRMCWLARKLIERGTRVVTINQFPTVFDRTTWDMHANGGRLNSTAADYRDTLCPQLDQALSGLLDDLAERGLLSETVVAVSGEMGRSPHINRYGGRDHHTGCWSGLLAGGPIPTGQVIGSSDACGEFPHTCPVTSTKFCATIYRALGIAVNDTPFPKAQPIALS